jgi:acyl-CoA reductase-like NAD-dependent aldehyde dehydrogenase
MDTTSLDVRLDNRGEEFTMLQPFSEQVNRSRAAQASWSRLSIGERLRHIRALRNLIAIRTDALVEAVKSDIGRLPVEVIATELLPAAAALKFLEQRAQRVLAPHRIGWRLRPTWLMGCRDVIHRRPWGVVGIIGTWNYPIYLNVGPIAQALVAGNAVLWKPSENAPKTADLLHALFLEAGFPAELFQLLPATREAGPMLAEAEIDRMVFTGSDGVGRKLAAKLGERLIPSTLELSGCDAMFVMADANLEMAVKAAWFGVTLNRGQTCIAVRRFFIHRSIYKAFIEAIRKLPHNVKPMELVTAGQVEQAQRLIDNAVKRGARVLALTPQPLLPGGEGERATTVQPTLLLDTPVDAAICREACFAPIAAVIPFDSVDEAIAMAKQCSFGLGASIFTSDVEMAQSLAVRIPAGSVTINDLLAPTAHPATPFGGRGTSGWGVTQGAEGLLEMTVPQVVTVHKGTFRPHLDEAVNPDPSTGDILSGLLRLTHARGVREKLRGLWQMVRGVRRKGEPGA